MPVAIHNEDANAAEPPRLLRLIGRWTMTALTVNILIGSGIFGLPSTLAGKLGRFSPWGMVLGGLGTGVIMACFAEVASYFTSAGGPYLYARVTFGRFIGLQTGWLYWLARFTAPAANANVFVLYLGELWPHAKDPLPRAIVLTVLIWGLATINILGVREGAQVSNAFTVAKLVPLLTLGIGGLIFLGLHPHAPAVPAPAPSVDSGLRAGLLVLFAYGGFDAALLQGESKNPRRDCAFALFAALLTCIVIYTLTQWVALNTVPGLAHSDRPLADAARSMWGSLGATLVAVAAMLSVFGNLSGNLLAVPRITFAMAEQGDFPAIFAAVHPRFRTPYVSVAAFALLTWAFALSGSFAWNVTLSAIARLFYYGACCVALIVLRKKMPGGALFRVPGGPWLAVLGVMICVVLFTRVDLEGFLILLVTVALATINWLLVRKRPAASQL